MSRAKKLRCVTRQGHPTANIKGWFVLVYLMCAGACRISNAQTIGATISGVITDPSGSSIPGARLAFRNLSRLDTRSAATDERGFFSVPNLAPAEYEVSASAGGFETQLARITLTVGSEQELNFSMRIGQIGQRVGVEAPADGIALATSTLGAAVRGAVVVGLPLNGRSWTDLAALEPGVTTIQAQVSYTAGNGRGNRGFGGQLAIGGGRPQQNNYRLDGVSINDYSNGGPRSVLGGKLGVEAVQEFSVLTGSYPASYGKASGGVINATTASGTNDFHGALYEYLRNSVLDARNFFDAASTPPFRRNQFGAAGGGPAIKSRTFLFG